MSKTLSDQVQKAVAQVSAIIRPVESAYLHSAIMIAGKTETTINKHRIPAIQEIGWDKDGFLLIITANKTHCLPSAAVSQTILIG